MGMRGTCWFAAALAFTCASAAQTDRAMSVGYSTPSARLDLVTRAPADAPVPEPAGGADWQRAATHLDAVPTSVLDAAASFTIAVVDTGADLSSPALAAKRPITYNVATGGGPATHPPRPGTLLAPPPARLGGEGRLW